MKKNGFSHIRKWLYIYLGLVLLTTFVTCLLIYVEITNSLDVGVSAATGKPARSSDGIISSSLPGLKIKILLLLTGGLGTIGVLGVMWIGIAARHLGRPVRQISQAMSNLAQGRLNETVTIDTPDEFGQIGSGINELAVNLQELLLYIWKQTGHCLALVEHLQNSPDLRHDRRLTLEGLGYLKQLAEAIDDLRDMAKAYVFYDVRLEGDKTLAIDEPGHPVQTDEHLQ